MSTEMAALPSTRASGTARPLLLRLADQILTTDRRQRRRLAALLLTALAVVAGIALMTAGAMLAVFRWRHVALLAALSAATMLTFYVIIRAGWNLRFADPTLAYPQTIAAQTLVAGAYAVLDPAHSATLILFALVLVFAMFNMSGEAVRAACVYTVVAIGAVTAWRGYTHPQHYPALREAFNFIVAAGVMAAIARLAGRLTRLHQRLKMQRAALQDALVQVRELATRDELTGLPNRRHMLDLLHAHAQRRSRGGQRFYVGRIDLDHFQTINDHYGRWIGDEALRAFAGQAQAVLRVTDAIGRWEGEEFLLILAEYGRVDPTECMERLRAALASTCVDDTVPGLRVAFSAGLTRFKDGEAIGQVIARADHALHMAKSAGRGRTVLL